MVNHLRIVMILIPLLFLTACASMGNLQSPQATAAKGLLTFGVIKKVQADKAKDPQRAAREVAGLRKLGKAVNDYLDGNLVSGITLKNLRAEVDKYLATQNLAAEDIALIQSIRPLADMYIQDLIDKVHITNGKLTSEQVFAIKGVIAEIGSSLTIAGF